MPDVFVTWERKSQSPSTKTPTDPEQCRGVKTIEEVLFTEGRQKNLSHGLWRNETNAGCYVEMSRSCWELLTSEFEGRSRPVDTRSQYQGGENLSASRQIGKSVGRRLIAERCLVRGQNLLRESRLRTHRAA